MAVLSIMGFYVNGFLSRVLPRRNLEAIGAVGISGRFAPVDQSSRFAGVPNLGKPL